MRWVWLAFILLLPGIGSAEQSMEEFASEFYEARGCSFSAPSVDCVGKIMSPLSETEGLPFDKAKVAAAWTPFGPQLALEWSLTTLHRIPSTGLGGQAGCALGEFAYSEQPFSLPGCGLFLFTGGHPALRSCKDRANPLSCMDSIPLAQRPDIGLRKASPKSEFLQAAAAESIQEAATIYIVHQPFFQWLDPQTAKSLQHKGPFITRGIVIRQEGTTAAAMAPIFQGSSGGTVLNERGEVIGIVTAGAKGAPMFYFQTLNKRMLEIIRRVQ